MAERNHTYEVRVRWTGNTGRGTASPGGYSRDHLVLSEGKEPIQGSSDPAFRGDATRYNPEELLVASLSQCHMLWFLGLCARDGIVVTAYEDHATGAMVEHTDGSGEFVQVTLRPAITLADPAQQQACDALHGEAHHLCFIARSVKFPVRVEAIYTA